MRKLLIFVLILSFAFIAFACDTQTASNETTNTKMEPINENPEKITAIERAKTGITKHFATFDEMVKKARLLKKKLDNGNCTVEQPGNSYLIKCKKDCPCAHKRISERVSQALNELHMDKIPLDDCDVAYHEDDSVKINCHRKGCECRNQYDIFFIKTYDYRFRWKISKNESINIQLCSNSFFPYTEFYSLDVTIGAPNDFEKMHCRQKKDSDAIICSDPGIFQLMGGTGYNPCVNEPNNYVSDGPQIEMFSSQQDFYWRTRHFREIMFKLNKIVADRHYDATTKANGT